MRGKNGNHPKVNKLYRKREETRRKRRRDYYCSTTNNTNNKCCPRTWSLVSTRSPRLQPETVLERSLPWTSHFFRGENSEAKNREIMLMTLFREITHACCWCSSIIYKLVLVRLLLLRVIIRTRNGTKKESTPAARGEREDGFEVWERRTFGVVFEDSWWWGGWSRGKSSSDTKRKNDL